MTRKAFVIAWHVKADTLPYPNKDSIIHFLMPARAGSLRILFSFLPQLS